MSSRQRMTMAVRKKDDLIKKDGVFINNQEEDYQSQSPQPMSPINMKFSFD